MIKASKSRQSLSILFIILLTNFPVANATIFPNVNATSNETLIIGSSDSVDYTSNYGDAVSANITLLSFIKLV